MRKKLVPLLLMTALVLVGCGSGSSGSYTTKVKTSEEQIVSSAQFGSGGDVTQMEASSGKEETKDDAEAPAADNAGSTGGKPKIWFINNANGIGWSAAFSGSMNSTFDTDAYDYTFVDGQGDFDIQVKGIEDAIAAQPDLICFSPIAEDGYEDVLQKAKDAGIKVLIVDRMVSADDSLYEGWVGSNFDLEGENAGNWLVDTAGDKEMNIVILQGNEGASAQIGRHDGFARVIEQHKNFKVLAEDYADFDKGKAVTLMQEYLDKYGDQINVIVTHNDNMCYGVMETLTNNNIDPNKYIIISFDGEAEAFKLMMDDAKIDVDIECNPLIGPTVEKLVGKILAGETIEKKNYVEEGVYTADMAADELDNRQY